MEYQQRRETIAIHERIYDGCQEQPVDLELTLPDYCPDIQKILKCQITPSITAASMVGDSLDVNGSVTVRVLYLDAGGSSIRCCENAAQFSATIPVKSTTGSGVASVRANVEYVNCRATSPRRLNIHGAFSLWATVWEQRDLELLTGIDDEDVEQRMETVELSTSAGLTQQQFSIEEVLELGEGKPNAEQILRTDGVVVPEEWKVLDNQVTVSGHVCLKVLYLTDLRDALPETMEYTLPFRQVFDCGMATSHAQLCGTIQVQGVFVQCKSDAAGENSLLETEVRLCAAVQLYEDRPVTLLTDAYARSCEVTLERQQRTFLRFDGMLSDNCTQKNAFDFPNSGISKVIDVWNESRSVTASFEENTLNYKGKFNLCLLALDGDGKPFYFERMLELNSSREGAGREDCQCHCAVELANITYRITGSNSIEIKTEFRLETSLFREEVCRCLSEVIPNEDLPKQKDSAASLVLYYSPGGEALWDIAKQYSTGVGEIQSENALEDDVLDRPAMLLIPV